jgi:ElaB/YqjD/DUF883 family membrane-anchored ribosome-binding protein
MAAEVSVKPAAVNDSQRGISRIRSIVTDTVEDGIRSAKQAIRHGRYGAEDALDEMKHTVKHHPFQAVGGAFAAGVVAGGLFAFAAGVVAGRLLTLIGSRNR